MAFVFTNEGLQTKNTMIFDEMNDDVVVPAADDAVEMPAVEEETEEAPMGGDVAEDAA